MYYSYSSMNSDPLPPPLPPSTMLSFECTIEGRIQLLGWFSTSVGPERLTPDA